MKQVQDHYFKKAKTDGYVARSAYKLEEADRRFQLFKPNQRVLDLGCYPGSWLQYIYFRVIQRGKQGLVVGVDRTPVGISLGSQVITLEKDIYSCSVEDFNQFTPSYSAVVSDMAPNTTGNRDVDHLESMGLCEKAWELAKDLLEPGGFFYCKLFEGSESAAFAQEVRQHCKKVKWIKPKGSRKESRELFILGVDFKLAN